MSTISPIAAKKVKQLLIDLSPIMEHYTAGVCPDCRDVCCKQRHGIMNDLDHGYVAALGETVLPEDPTRPLDGPCRFMGREGCTIPRWRRPWRCTAYFCDPLLEAMNRGPQRTARNISRLIQEIVDIRGRWAAALSPLAEGEHHE